MRAMLIVSVAVLACAMLFLAAGCGSKKGKHGDIKPGMTYQQVIEMMGKPEKEFDMPPPAGPTPEDKILKRSAVWNEEDGTMLTCYFNGKNIVVKKGRQNPPKR